MPWIATLPVALGVFTITVAHAGLQDAKPARALPRAGRPVHALARLEPASGLIVVGARPGARILELRVRAGDSVEAGDLIAVLEGNAQAVAQLALAEAKRSAARATRDRKRRELALERERSDRLQQTRRTMLENGYRAVSAHVKNLSAALAALPATSSQQDRLTLASSVEQFRALEYDAYTKLEQAKVEDELLPRARATEDEALADASAEFAVFDREVALAQAALEASHVLAPSKGIVLSTHVHSGEVSSGPLVTLGDTAAMVARAEVDHEDIPAIQVGDAARVELHGQAIEGRVSRIARVVGVNRLVSIDPRARQDLRVVEVTIELAEAGAAAAFVGLQVEAVITPNSAAREP